jgi:hypothetical protein
MLLAQKAQSRFEEATYQEEKIEKKKIFASTDLDLA